MRSNLNIYVFFLLFWKSNAARIAKRVPNLLMADPLLLTGHTIEENVCLYECGRLELDKKVGSNLGS